MNRIKSAADIEKKKKRDPNFQEGHRQRLFKKMFANQITDYEMLEIMLTIAVPRRDMRKLAHELIFTFGNYHSVLLAPADRLLEVNGVGPQIVKVLQAAHKSCIFESNGILKSRPVFKNYNAILNYCKFEIGLKNIEEAHALYLDARSRLITNDLLNIGTNNHVEINQRNILARALYLNAASIILAHNHPCFGARFSDDDIRTTMNLREYLERENIIVIDHILVSGGVAYSLNAEMAPDKINRY